MQGIIASDDTYTESFLIESKIFTLSENAEYRSAKQFDFYEITR